MSIARKKLIILLIIVLIGLFCYTEYNVYSNFIAVKNNSQSNSKIFKREKSSDEVDVKEKILDITNIEVQQLYNRISNGIGFSCGVSEYYKDNKITNTSIPNEVAYSVALANLLGNEGENGANISNNFTEESLKGEIAKIFGKSYNFVNQTYTTCPQYNYIANTNTYKYVGGKCNTICKAGNMVKIVKALKKADTIEIYTRVLFIDSNSVTLKYYRDFNRTQLITDLSVDKSGVPYESDLNYAKGSLYKILFAKEDNNYIFTSSELIAETTNN